MPVPQRPVTNVFPPKLGSRIINPDGSINKEFQAFCVKLWERSGGPVDEFSAILAAIALGETSGIVANARADQTLRALQDAVQTARQTQIDRLSSRLTAVETSQSVQLAVMNGLLGFPPPTRIIRFDANDTWRLSPDVRSIYVACVGGGGGGGGGTAGSNGGGGGGGANFSEGWLEGQYLPSSVAVTVGIGGSGGAASSPGTDGSPSSFGSYFAAEGGDHGRANGVPGSARTTPGGVFLGGAGGAGNSGGGDGSDAPNDCLGCPGGGGGAYSSGGDAGGDGGAGSRRSLLATGGGGAGGLSTGGSGSADPSSQTLIGPGLGGGGGGTTNSVSGGGGQGYNGAGGGGGAARAGGAGSGGAGGPGVVWVVEYY